MRWMSVLAQAETEGVAAEETPGPPETAPAAGEDRPVERAVESMVQRLGETFELTPWTGWIFLLAAIFVGLLGGKLAQNLLRGIGRRMLDTGWNFRGTIFVDAAGPANLALIAVGASVGMTAIRMPQQLWELTYHSIIPFLYIVAMGWFVFNLVDLVDVTMRRFATRQEGKLHEQVIPLIRKTLRIFVVAVFALFVAENVFGANIGAWLAGLGIAGLAVSLAAQDSLKNLFGSITIFLDKPYGLGDRVNVAGFDGTVEEIGFRSTKIRTLTGHLVTIPNSKIVDGSVENIAKRPHVRRLLNVTITYDTAPEKIEQAVQIIRDILSEPEVAEAFRDMEKFPPRVFFNDFNATSLNIIVLYWFYPADWWLFQEHGQRFNLKLVRAFEAAGIEFAFPTQTLYLAGDPRRELAVRTGGLSDGEVSTQAG
jgi:MscS family membrane protein